jgi:hypothetical protein
MKTVQDGFTAGFESNSNHLASAECLQPRKYLGEQFSTFQTIGKDSAGAVLTAIYLVNTETQLEWILTDKKGARKTMRKLPVSFSGRILLFLRLAACQLCVDVNKFSSRNHELVTS